MDNVNKIERLQRQKALLAKANNTLAELLLKNSPTVRVPRTESAQQLIRLSQDCSEELRFFQKLIQSYEDHIQSQQICINELSQSLRKLKVQIGAVTAQNQQFQHALRQTVRQDGNSKGVKSMRQELEKLLLQQQREKNRLLQQQVRVLEKRHYQIREEVIEKENSINEKMKLYNQLFLKSQEDKTRFVQMQIQINQFRGLSKFQEAKILAQKKRTQHFEKRSQQLEVQLHKTKSSLQIVSAKLQSLKSASTQSQSVLKHQVSSAKRQIQLLRGRQKQIILKMTSAQKQNDMIKQDIRNIRNSNQNLRLEHTELLRMTQNYQNKVLSAKRREDQLTQQLRELKDRLALTVTQRDNLDFKVQQQVRRIERMARQHRDQLARSKAIKT